MRRERARFRRHAHVLPYGELNYVGWRPPGAELMRVPRVPGALIAHHAFGPNRSKYGLIFKFLRCGSGGGGGGGGVHGAAAEAPRRPGRQLLA